jgi:zinc/manganese transport system substrate-binding protein
LPAVTNSTRRILLAITALLCTAALAGCGGSSSTPSGGSGKLSVVAAENFWGSITAQLAGDRAVVHSIITNPAADPHSYEPKAADARAIATAQLVIVNGIGYDPWAPKLIAANPSNKRLTLNIGDILGKHEGDNPHRWYDPADIDRIAIEITGRLGQLSPKDIGYFNRRLQDFELRALARYHGLISAINTRYGGVPVGASESIFALLSPALGLNLITPPSFMKAISEGTEVTAQDTAATERQITDHKVKVWVYNSQNATPGIQRLNALARARGIPVATVTETLTPAGASFEDWQSAQLEGLQRALHQATGH